MSIGPNRRVAGRVAMVTGGCGFIGSHLVDRLCREGVEKVIVVDNMRCGNAENLGIRSPRVEFVRFDLGADSMAVLEPSLRGTHLLFHLAAEKHNQCKDAPERMLRSNVIGMHDLLEAACRQGVQRVLFSSSLYAYGRMQGGPFREDEMPRPDTVYGISKLAGEHLLHHFRKKHGLKSTALRFLFVYGPKQYAGMGYKSVIMKNFERILRGEGPVVIGDGQQALDYVYVDDVVEGILAALDPRGEGELFNVGSGKAVTIEELTRTMLQAAGANLPVVQGPPDWTAGSCRVADVRRIKEILGWSARVTLMEGLSRTCEWLRSQATGVSSDPRKEPVSHG